MECILTGLDDGVRRFGVRNGNLLGESGVQLVPAVQDGRSPHAGYPPSGVGFVKNAVVPGTCHIAENKDIMDVGGLLVLFFRTPDADKRPLLLAGRQRGQS